MRPITAIAIVLILLGSTDIARAAANLHLAPNVSFNDDSGADFPIKGTGLDAGPTADKATIVFFGTSNCWNTAREAERLVTLYPQYKNRIDFVVVDLNHVSASQQPLVTRYYRGAIPTIAVLDAKGNLLYDRAGETAHARGDTSNLQKLLDSANQ